MGCTGPTPNTVVRLPSRGVHLLGAGLGQTEVDSWKVAAETTQARSSMPT